MDQTLKDLKKVVLDLMKPQIAELKEANKKQIDVNTRLTLRYSELYEGLRELFYSLELYIRGIINKRKVVKDLRMLKEKLDSKVGSARQTVKQPDPFKFCSKCGYSGNVRDIVCPECHNSYFRKTEKKEYIDFDTKEYSWGKDYGLGEDSGGNEPCPICSGDKLDDLNQIEDEDKRYHAIQDFINELLSSRGEKEGSSKVTSGIIGATLKSTDSKLPELTCPFCGRKLIRYKQAWICGHGCTKPAIRPDEKLPESKKNWIAKSCYTDEWILERYNCFGKFDNSNPECIEYCSKEVMERCKLKHSKTEKKELVGWDMEEFFNTKDSRGEKELPKHENGLNHMHGINSETSVSDSKPTEPKRDWEHKEKLPELERDWEKKESQCSRCKHQIIVHKKYNCDLGLIYPDGGPISGANCYAFEPKTGPEKNGNEEEWECPICEKVVFIGYTVHRSCLDDLMEKLKNTIKKGD